MKRTLALLGSSAAIVAACSGINNHLLEGQQFVPGSGCIDPAVVIDDVAGGDPGTCAPECIVASAEGGPLVFVTTTCPPYPPYFTSEKQGGSHPASDPCPAAFAAYADGSLCTGEAGAPVEAGPEAASDAHPEGAVEASSDAGSDGATDATDGG